MSTAGDDFQNFLRFLTRDAKLPLSHATGETTEMQKDSLTSPTSLTRTDSETLQAVSKPALAKIDPKSLQALYSDEITAFATTDLKSLQAEISDENTALATTDLKSFQAVFPDEKTAGHILVAAKKFLKAVSPDEKPALATTDLKTLQAASPDENLALATTDLKSPQIVFSDEKTARQILGAANTFLKAAQSVSKEGTQISKKRNLGDDTEPEPISKKGTQVSKQGTQISKKRKLGDDTEPEPVSKKRKRVSKQRKLGDDTEPEPVSKERTQVSKKRKLGDDTEPEPSPKKRRTATVAPNNFPVFSLMKSPLTLPSAAANITDSELSGIILGTSSVRLNTAFAVVLLSYTMPEQSLESRLSLARAVPVANKLSKATSMGRLTKGVLAEQQGWGKGYPEVRIMGGNVKVLKWWGNERKNKEEEDWKKRMLAMQAVDESQGKIKVEDDIPAISEKIATIDVGKAEATHRALWGLDLEALRSSNEGRGISRIRNEATFGLPIYSPYHTKSYLLSSFHSPPSGTAPHQKSEKTPATISAIENNLALLLCALDKLHASWAPVLSTEELDRRSWDWFEAVKPQSRWKRKAEVRLESILALRRMT